ncbi:MAG: DUF433 domain-containing protein [Gemmatimonadales bacterium]
MSQFVQVIFARDLSADPGGVLRVSGTRVPLDSVVDLYDEGASAEEIVEQFDTLTLADVHPVLGYYLRHQDEIRAHLADEDRWAAERRTEVEAKYSNKPLRERLRKAKKGRSGE